MTAMLFDFPSAPIPRRRSRPKKEADQGYSPEFEAFWTAYPRKLNCSKFEASKSWDKLTDEMQSQAMAVLPIFGRQCAGKDEQYICHAATWINQRRFETVAIPVQPQQTININWPQVIKIWQATGRWNHEAYGPEPGQTGSKAPPQK